MKPRKDEIAITATFCVFLAVMCLLYLFLPKDSFSQLEKRYLAETPEVSWKNIASGQFGEDAETYMADHIPGRDFFVGLNAYFELLTGRQNASDIYTTQDGRLVEAPAKWNEAGVAKNMSAINSFAQAVGQTVDLLLVPSAGWASRENIAGPSAPYQDAELIQAIYAMAQDSVSPLDVTARFDDPGLYYRTDHHWTSQGAYTAYEAYMTSLGREYRDQSDFTIETASGFYGSTYSRAALWLTPAEDLELWTGSTSVTVTNGDSDTVNQSIFYRQRLEETDKYTVYLDGNHSLVRIENPDAKGCGKLLVIRDSYSNCLGGFLAESYETVVLVDLRYYNKSISQLCQEEGFDNILVCYSLGNFLTDANIIWLR